MFWGFVASMYVGNLMLLALNLPLVGMFVNVLRIPYAYLYPLVIMFCIIGVYEVSHSIVDVWIMLIMGVVGYGLRKLRARSSPAGAWFGDLADIGNELAPIAHHVERQLDDILPAADRARAASDLRGAAGAGRLIGHPQPNDWRSRLAEAEAGDH